MRGMEDDDDCGCDSCEDCTCDTGTTTNQYGDQINSKGDYIGLDPTLIDD